MAVNKTVYIVSRVYYSMSKQSENYSNEYTDSINCKFHKGFDDEETAIKEAARMSSVDDAENAEYRVVESKTHWLCAPDSAHNKAWLKPMDADAMAIGHRLVWANGRYHETI